MTGPARTTSKTALVAAGATFTCVATHPAPAPDVQHTNLATVTGTPPAGADVSDTDSANANVPALTSIEVVKKINGDDANSAAGITVPPGSTMAITFDVTNTSNVALTNVTVTDDVIAVGNITCDGPGSDNIKDGAVAAGATFQCVATLPAPAGAAAAHQRRHRHRHPTQRCRRLRHRGPSPTTSHVDLELTKNDDGLTKIAGGAAFDYTITVRNVGTRALVVDPVVVDVLPAEMVYVLPLPAGCTAAGSDLDLYWCDRGCGQRGGCGWCGDHGQGPVQGQHRVGDVYEQGVCGQF